MSSISRGGDSTIPTKKHPSAAETELSLEELAKKNADSMKLLADYIRRDATTAANFYLLRSNTSHDGE